MKKLLALIIFALIAALAVACVAEDNASSPDESTPVLNQSSALPETSEEDSVPEASEEVSEEVSDEVSEEISEEVSEEVAPPNTGTAVFDMNITTSGSFDDEVSETDGYINFIDYDAIGRNWKV